MSIISCFLPSWVWICACPFPIVCFVECLRFVCLIFFSCVRCFCLCSLFSSVNSAAAVRWHACVSVTQLRGNCKSWRELHLEKCRCYSFPYQMFKLGVPMSTNSILVLLFFKKQLAYIFAMLLFTSFVYDINLSLFFISCETFFFVVFLTSVQFVAQDKHSFFLCTWLDSTGNTMFAVCSNFPYLVEKCYAFVLVFVQSTFRAAFESTFFVQILLMAQFLKCRFELLWPFLYMSSPFFLFLKWLYSHEGKTIFSKLLGLPFFLMWNVAVLSTWRILLELMARSRAVSAWSLLHLLMIERPRLNRFNSS